MLLKPSQKKNRGRSKSTIAELNLTSLVDIFTIILLFLLKSYSAEPEILVPNPKLKLPISTASEAPVMKLIVQISSDDIIVEGENIVRVVDALETEETLIKPLLEALNRSTEMTEFIAKSNPLIKFTGDVIIQGDKEIPFILLEKVMYTCGQAGYGNISLAVISRE